MHSSKVIFLAYSWSSGCLPVSSFWLWNLCKSTAMPFVSMFCITALFFASVNCLFSCRICQDIFWRLHERGYISQDTVDQLQCQNCDRLEHFQLSILLLICTENVVVLDFHASSLINSLHAEMVCTLPFINAEINVIGLRSKWQALPRKPWAVPKGGFV